MRFSRIGYVFRSLEVIWRSDEVIWWPGHPRYIKFIEIPAY